MSLDTLLASLPAWNAAVWRFDSDDLNGAANVGLSDDDPVDPLVDQSSAGNDFTANTAGVYESGITPTGQPVLRTAGSESYTLAYAADNHPRAASLFYAGKVASGAKTLVTQFQGSGGYAGWSAETTAGPQWDFYCGIGSTNYVRKVSQSFSASEFTVASFVVANNYVQIDQSNSETVSTLTSFTALTPGTADTFLFGSSPSTQLITGDHAILWLLQGRVSNAKASQIRHAMYRKEVAAATSSDTGDFTSAAVDSTGQSVTITLAAPGTAWATPFAVDTDGITLTLTRPTPGGSTGQTVLNGEADLLLESIATSSGSLVIVLRPRRVHIRDDDTLTISLAASAIYDGPGSSNEVISGSAVTNSSTVAYPKAIGNYNISRYETYSGTIHFDVDANHIDGIESVAIYVDDVLVGTATSRTAVTEASGRTATVFRVSASDSGFSDGQHSAAFVATPNFGDSDSIRDTRSDADDPGELIFFTNAGSTLTVPTYYVDTVSGDNGNDGGSSDPWADVDHAIGEVQDVGEDGAVIKLRQGTHTRAANKTTTPLANDRLVIIEADAATGADNTNTIFDPAGYEHVTRRLKIRNLAVPLSTRTFRGPTNGVGTPIATSKLILENCDLYGDYESGSGSSYLQWHSDLSGDPNRAWDEAPDLIGCTFRNYKANGQVVSNINLVRDVATDYTWPVVFGGCKAIQACASTNNVEPSVPDGQHSDWLFCHDGLSNDNVTVSNCSGLDLKGQMIFLKAAMTNVSIRNVLGVAHGNQEYQSAFDDDNGSPFVVDHIVIEHATVANQLFSFAANTTTNCRISDSVFAYFSADLDYTKVDNVHCWYALSAAASDIRASIGDPGFVDGAYDAAYDAGAVDYTPDSGSWLIGRTSQHYDLAGVLTEDIGALGTQVFIAPTLTATQTGATEVTLSWTDPAAEKYDVQISTDGENWQLVGEDFDIPSDESFVVDENNSPITLTGTLYFRLYFYDVAPTTAVGYSTSASVTLTALAPVTGTTLSIRLGLGM